MRVVEVGLDDRRGAPAAGGDRGLVADVREVGAGEACRLAGDRARGRRRRSSGLPRVWTARISRRAPSDRAAGSGSGGRSGPDGASAGSRSWSRFEAPITTTWSRGAEAVELDEQLVQRLVLLAVERVCRCARADGVELVDEDDRRARSCAPLRRACGCAPRRARRTSRRTPRRSARRSARPTRSRRPSRPASCRCRAGRGRGCPSARARPCARSASGRAGSRRPPEALPSPRRAPRPRPR